MQFMSWVRLGVAAALITTGAMADGGGTSFSASVIGSAPSLTIGGVPSGSVQWRVSQSNASLSTSGAGQAQLQVQVQGLVIATGSAIGTTGSVHMVSASVVCGGSGGSVVVSTPGVVLSLGGNAQIQANVPLVGACRAPVILVRAFDPSAEQGSQLGSFIASTGLAARSGNSELGEPDQDH
jgi:hypothetical protein